MIRNFLLAVAAFLLPFSSVWAGGPMAVGNIPPSMAENADIVCRYSTFHYTVHNHAQSTTRITMAYTILNGTVDDEYKFVKFYYDKFTKIKDASLVIYDTQGEVIKRYKLKDFEDRAAHDGFSMLLDDRVRFLRPALPAVPVTIAYECEYTQEGILGLPSWVAYPAYKYAVQRDEFTIAVPKGYTFHYKTVNGAPEPTQKTVDGKTEWTWSVQNMPALTEEPYAPDFDQINPNVLLAPAVFEYDGYKGTNNNWREYGAWVYSLLEGRDKLPAATEQKVRQLVASAPNFREKVARLYQYMQSRTRYVSVQLGIGGFQPFKAEDVDKNGYGDCKALSNYMHALLKAANIPSYYAIVGAAERHMRHIDFSSPNQFNHVILCVPEPGTRDSIWLECTSQRAPFGFLGDFTGNRHALLITPYGGIVSRTTRYRGADNVEQRTIEGKLLPDGSWTAKATLAAKGLCYDDWDAFLYLSGKDRADWLQKRFPIADAQSVEATATDSMLGKLPLLILQASFMRTRVATPQAGKLFLTLLPLRHEPVPNTATPRKYPIYLKADRTADDTFTFNLPEGYSPSFLPEEKHLKSPFGEYHRYVAQNKDGVLTIKRKWILNSGTYPAAQWPEFVDFLKKVVRADAEKAILEKK